MQIWTLDQFEQYISYENKSAGRLAFNIFFGTGIQEIELLALTIADFIKNEVESFLNLDKKYEVIKGVA